MSPNRAYIGALLIAIAGIMFWLLAMPAYDAIADRRAALADRDTILTGRAAIIANIASLNQQYAANAAELKRFSYVVPATKSAAELVSTVQALASQNGLTLTTIQLAGISTQDTNPYNTQAINLSLSGSYLAFRSFLSALESNIRLIDVLSVNANPTAENSSLISFQIRGNAYFLK